MSWYTGIAVYFLLWWIMLFTVLPIGVQKPEQPEKGHDPGAPVFPDLKRKFILNTAITTGLFIVLYVTVTVFDITMLEIFRD